MRLIIWAFAAFIGFALPANAAPVGIFISTVVAAVNSTAIGALFLPIVGRIAGFTALGWLSRTLLGKPNQGPQGLTTPIIMTGDVNPKSFIIGKYATAGQLVYPPITHGPTAYKPFVIAVSAKSRTKLSRIAIDGAWVTIGTTVHPDYGLEITGKYLGYAWVKYYDGTQTVADPMMVAKYGGHADYPYTADMVGAGNCYVIITLKANPSLYSGNPQFRIELYDMPLYDPRKDSTVGGSGTQRWDDQTTWTGTENPIVMIYNIKRGIDVGGGVIWGGQVEEADVPLTVFMPQMDYCDDDINGKPRYKAGFEVKLTEDNTPIVVIGELKKACAASVADVGGKWIINSGAPQQPTLFITDDDIVVSEGRTMSAVKAISTLHNAVSASYLDPANIYQPKDADLYSDPEALAEDGGRRRVASLQLPAVTDADQVLRLQKSALADDRQKKTHGLTLPARVAGAEPMDVISWTSARNGYAARVFQAGRVLHNPTTLEQHIGMRAFDYNDWP